MSDNLREPDFNSEHDLLVAASNEKSLKDSIDGLFIRANVLIFSYNRPRMLREAIESVLSQDYPNFDLYVVDDGSDIFDVWGLLEEYDDDRILLAQAPPISIEERLQRSRLGANANAVVTQLLDNEVVYYLCDDDLMAPKWLSRSIRTFQMMPEVHVIQGESWYFHDGQDPYTEAVYGMPTENYTNMPTMYWSTGSFAHKVHCMTKEGIFWTDNLHLHSQDTNFINDIWKAHPDYGMIQAPSIYRREHDKTLSAKLGRKNESGKYQAGYIPPPATAEMLRNLE